MIDNLRDLLHATPFSPFIIHTSGGKQYRVATADHASLSPQGDLVAVWSDKGGGLFLAVQHISGVETESALTA